jgi:N-acyl-D-aspartate/D-glutamate deacylase
LSSTDRAAVRAMNHAQKYLAQANRQIAELAVQVACQRVIVKRALDTGQRSEMAESLLDALEGSLRIFERHRIFLLGCSVNRPSKGDHPSAPTRRIPIGAP